MRMCSTQNLWLHLFCCLSLLYQDVITAPVGENVALKKPVYGNAKWPECLVDGKYETTISPADTTFPVVLVDLQDVYNLTSIHLHAQNEGTFGNLGLNIPFSVYIWDEPISQCDIEGYFPWKFVKKNLIFRKKGEEIILEGSFEALYIIILPDIKNPFKTNKGMPMGELRAFGTKIRDGLKFTMPEDGTYMPNVYVETRQQLLQGQERIYAQVSFTQYYTNTKYKDVSLAWSYDRVVAMAAIRQNARMVFLSGPKALRRLLTSPDYEPLRRNFRAWLSLNKTNAKFANVSENYGDGDILLITRADKFDVDVIYQRLVEGKNSAVFSYLMSKKYRDNRVAQLMKKLEIICKQVPRSFGNLDLNVSDFINSWRDVPYDFDLQVSLSSWKQFRTEQMKFFVPESEIWSPDLQKSVKKVLDKYYDFALYYGPCPLKRFPNDTELKTALVNYNKVLLMQRGEKVMVAPGALRSPGYVHPSLKPSNITVTFRTTVHSEFIPMGGYAKPGEAVRYKVLEHSEPYIPAYKIRINPQTDVVSNRERMARWPIVTLREFFKVEGMLVSPFGGPVVLDLPANTTFTVRFENVYRYPWLDLRNPESIKNWDHERTTYRGTPYGMIVGDSMISMLESRALYRMTKETAVWSTTFYDNIVKIMHNYRGTKFEEAQEEVFVTDDEIDLGYGHSGLPWMGYREWADSYDAVDSIKRSGNHGYAHELGHNLQVWKATFIGGTEVTNNMYVPVVNKYLLGLNSFGKGFWPGWSAGDEVNLIKTWKGKNYVGVEVSYYNYLGRMFSPALVSNVLTIFMHTKQPLSSEEEKVNFWIKNLCNESGYDLIPFHHLWHFPIWSATVSFCGKFPCVFPDDELTQQIPEVVDKTLKNHGKTCSRDKPRQVAFKNDLMRGINTTRPQMIFLKDE